MSDGSSYAIKSIGTVSLQTHDGAVRKLDEVRYILSIRHNLISLSRLNSSSYTWRAEDGILKVLRGSRIVMKGKSMEDTTFWHEAQCKVELQGQVDRT